MKFLDFLKEDGAVGSVTTSSIAAVQAPMIKEPMIARKKGKKIKIAKMFESDNNDFNLKDVKSKMVSAERKDKIKKDSAVYGIEDADGNITKVYVDKTQEHDFKQALGDILKDDDVPDIAEILFDLRHSFDILFVEWPKIPEDEETVNVMGKEDEDTPLKPGEDDATKEPGEPTAPEPAPAPAPEPAPEPDGQSILLQVIDMLRADAEAKKAESNAKAKEAEAETAKYSVQLSNIKVKNEEDMLKADEYYKKQADERKEQDRIAKLAKYRSEVVKNTTYESDMKFLNIMNDEYSEVISEDTNADVQQLQTQIADITSRKMRATKTYDDQLRILQQRLAAKTKIANQQQNKQPTQNQQQTMQNTQTQQSK